MGYYGAAGHSERGDGGVDVGQARELVGIDLAVAGTGNRQQVGVVAGGQRADEPDP